MRSVCLPPPARETILLHRVSNWQSGSPAGQSSFMLLWGARFSHVQTWRMYLSRLPAAGPIAPDGAISPRPQASSNCSHDFQLTALPVHRACQSDAHFASIASRLGIPSGASGGPCSLVWTVPLNRSSFTHHPTRSLSSSFHRSSSDSLFALVFARAQRFRTRRFSTDG